MENTTKTDNFLQAIQRYTEEQKSIANTEVELLKEEKLKKAEENGKRDSERYIQQQLEAKKYMTADKSPVSALVFVSRLVQESQKKLFRERAKMTDEVFEMAAQKLIKYTETKEYKLKLVDSARQIAELFDDNRCVVYINEKDMKYSTEILAAFHGMAELVKDNSIKIGGLKGYCKSMRIVADETLDTKLSAQREWFIENSGLSVLN